MMTKVFQKKSVIDSVFLFSIILLTILGIITMVSVSLDKNGMILWEGRLQKQLLYVFIGILLFFLFSSLDANIFRSYFISGGLYLLTLFALLLTKIAGPTINGVNRWLLIGGIQIQPSEFAKVVLILLIAGLYANNENENQYKIAINSILLSLPIIFLVFIEPHGSMSILITILVFLINLFVLQDLEKHIVLMLILTGNIIGIILLGYNQIFVGGGIMLFNFLITLLFLFGKRISWSKILLSTYILSLLLGLMTYALIPIAWDHLLHDYQKERIETFLHPEKATKDESLNLQQSIVAVGSGRILGKGWGSGTQSKLRFLPEYNTDFIFASYAEQFGLIGDLLLLFTFLILILKLLQYAFESKYNVFYSVFLLGLALLFALEILISVGTNIGLVPVTGLPLPFFSFGGTIALTTYIALGIAFSMIKSLREDNLNKYVDNNSFLI